LNRDLIIMHRPPTRSVVTGQSGAATCYATDTALRPGDRSTPAAAVVVVLQWLVTFR
jgi:hypothetical protein